MWYKGLNKMDISLIADHILDEEDNVRGTADSFCENPLSAQNKTLLEQIDWESYMWGSFHQNGASDSTPQRDTYASSSAPPPGKVATDNNMSSLVGGLVSILKQKSAGNSGAGQGHARVSTHSLDHQDDETARETLANLLVTHFSAVRRRIMENNMTPRTSIDEESDVTPTGTLSSDAVITLSFPKDARTPFGKFLKNVVNSVTAGTSEEWQQVRASLALLGLGTPQMAIAAFTQWRNGSDTKGTENPIVKILVRLFNYDTSIIRQRRRRWLWRLLATQELHSRKKKFNHHILLLHDHSTS
jgi:hypothetical protein